MRYTGNTDIQLNSMHYGCHHNTERPVPPFGCVSYIWYSSAMLTLKSSGSKQSELGSCPPEPCDEFELVSFFPLSLPPARYL